MPVLPNPNANSELPFIAECWVTPTKRAQRYCLTREEAELWIVSNLCDKSAGELPSFSCETALQWFLNEELGRGRVTRSVERTRLRLTDYFLKPLAGRQIGLVGVTDVRAIRTFIETRPDLQPRVAYQHYAEVRFMFDQLYARGFLVSNPAVVASEGFECVKQQPRALLTPTLGEMARMRGLAQSVELCMLLLATQRGVTGEQMSLIRWPDIVWPCEEFPRGRLFVRHTVLEGDNPDMPAGRSLDLTDDLVAALKWWRLVQRRLHPAAQYVFHSTDGGQRTATAILENMRALQRTAGVFHIHYEKGRAKPDQRRARYGFANFVHLAALAWCDEVGMTTLRLKTLLGASTVRSVLRKYGAILQQKRAA